MSERRKLVAANWKMNGSLATNQALIGGILDGFDADGLNEVALCPPCVYLDSVAAALDGHNIALGAQNVSHMPAGAYTGEVSPGMLRDFGCHYVITGHSERRALYHETDARVAEKFAAVVAAGLSPILCVGESPAEREAGATRQVIARQLDAVLEQVGIERFGNAVIAYEPVWAIGTGNTATPEQAQAVHEFIRLRLARHSSDIAAAIRIIHGGSVKPDNAAQLFAMADIDGGLIGGASLVTNDFLTICRA